MWANGAAFRVTTAPEKNFLHTRIHRFVIFSVHLFAVGSVIVKSLLQLPHSAPVSVVNPACVLLRVCGFLFCVVRDNNEKKKEFRQAVGGRLSI